MNDATEEICEAFTARYGLDEPIPVQFVAVHHANSCTVSTWATPSASGAARSTEILVERLPTTIELAFYALVFASIVGVILGLAAALCAATRRRTSSTMVTATLGVSIPIFVLALLLQFLFAVVLRGTIFRAAITRPSLLSGPGNS